MFDLSDLKKFKSNVNIDKDDILRYLGVEERRSGGDVFFTGLGLFAAGIIVGAGAALLLAPKTGAEMRTDLKHRIQSGTEQALSGQLSGTGASNTRSNI